MRKDVIVRCLVKIKKERWTDNNKLFRWKLKERDVNNVLWWKLKERERW